MKSSIVVVGSSNTDMVIKTDHLPVPGETILGGTFFMNAGGKGANQAVAAARLGGSITFIGKTGDDIFGRQAVQSFKEEGIDTTYMVTDREQPSGVALITVDKNAENCIVVASGANATLSNHDIEPALEKITDATIILMQLETPLETISYVASMASGNNVKVILNPAPACSLPDSLLQNVFILTPNQTEAAILSGIEITDLASAEAAAQIIRSKGVNIVIITLGARGALLVQEDLIQLVSSPIVEAVDSTAAGDIFNGALAVALAEEKEIICAIRFACKAAAISVTRLGAQASAPYRTEVEATMVLK